MAQHPYPADELPRAIQTIGKAFEFAERCLPEGAAGLYGRFVRSSIAASFEGPAGHPQIGTSAIKLVLDVNEDASIDTMLMNEQRLSKEDTRRLRWEAEAVVRYQWETGLPFRSVHNLLDAERLDALFEESGHLPPADIVPLLIEPQPETAAPTNLARLRRDHGLSQQGLASASGVSLRSIQQYEQRKKDINHAQARSVFQLARTLGCAMEDLLEPARD